MASVLVWANLQTSAGWEDAGFRGPGWGPPERDPITRYFFSRGWPLSPWWVCIYHGNRFRTEESPVRFVLVLNGIVACLILYGTATLSEWLSGRLKRNSPE